MKHRLFFALPVVLLAMMGFWGPAHAQNPQLTTHDNNQTSQHNNLSGQVTTHNAAQTTHDTAQTNQHNSLSGQVTTHDSAQTSQHNQLNQKVDNQTSQHNSLSGQVTTHDSAQTSQHKELNQKIDKLGDHSGLPQAWDKTLPANDPGGACPSNSSRFTCVMGGAAVRDNETGLVWERPPEQDFRVPWEAAQIHCNQLNVGDRQGWRLPTLQELASLVPLPAGHPFSNVQPLGYWSATSGVRADSAWVVNFPYGPVAPGANKADFWSTWCVRGGQGVDPQ
jgi:uncharacterized protein DUF1566